MPRVSELTFKNILDSQFSGFTRVIYNGRNIFDDCDDGLYIEGKKVKTGLKKDFYDGYDHGIHNAIKAFEEKYGPKHIYSFYCRVVNFHHTEMYIEGEK